MDEEGIAELFMDDSVLADVASRYLNMSTLYPTAFETKSLYIIRACRLSQHDITRGL